MDFAETTIKTYSGLSSETKPTIAGGTDVPNGSRWREVGPNGIDTGKIYYFNLSDDAWYLVPEKVVLYDPINDRQLELEDDSSVPITEKNNFFIDIAKGDVPGVGSEFKFGHSAVVNATESIVWDGGGNYTFLTTAETMDIVSTSTDDDLVGIGAQTLIVYGLDADFNEVNEVVEMDGTAPVTTIAEFIRVFRALVITSGTNDPINDANKGIITITGTDTATLQAGIGVNNGQTLMAVYTVPAGKTGYVTGVSLSCGQGKQCLFKGKFRNGPTSAYAFSVKFILELYENTFYGTLVTPLVVPEKTDIVWTAETSSGTISAGASFGILLEDN